MMLQDPGPPMPPMPPSVQFDPNLIPPPVFAFIVIAALAAAVIILWPIMRALARRLEGKGSGDAALKAEVEQLHHRLGDVDLLHSRVAELEERVDFTERLLAQTHDAPGRALRGETQ
jgi:flagellar biosynthesis/type III secretory pathway M-ring protein FliF/YscJ